MKNTIGAQATSAYLNEAIGEGEQPIKAHLTLCWTEDRTELKEMRDQAASAISQMGAVPRQTIGATNLVGGVCPVMQPELPVNESFDTFASELHVS